MKRTTLLRPACAAALLLAGSSAIAHTGHGSTSLFEGLVHPLGTDHLLAMLAVGAWSATAFSGARRALAPLAFLAAMTVGALLGFGGVALPVVEAAIAASVIAFGALLALGSRVPSGAGLALIGTGALLHGLAHGAELPVGASAAGYAIGFLVTTALLQAGGLGLGALLRAAGRLARPLAGVLLGGAGLLILARV